MDFERELAVLEKRFKISSDRAYTTSFDIHRNIQVTLDFAMTNHGWSGDDTYIRYISQTDMFATRCINQQIAKIAEALTILRHAPHNHIEDLLFLEEATHLKT